MNRIKGSLLFLLKSFVFSVVFFSTVFGFYAISPLNSPRKQKPDNADAIYIQEYNRQSLDSSKALEQYKDLLRRSEANMTEQEKNAKRMSAIFDLWEHQARKGK